MFIFHALLIIFWNHAKKNPCKQAFMSINVKTNEKKSALADMQYVKKLLFLLINLEEKVSCRGSNGYTWNKKKMFQMRE